MTLHVTKMTPEEFDDLPRYSSPDTLLGVARRLALGEAIKVPHPDVTCGRGTPGTGNRKCQAAESIHRSGTRDRPKRRYNIPHVSTPGGGVEIAIKYIGEPDA
jgi:hypothetical protein